jgi:epoxyqueuosine reductase
VALGNAPAGDADTVACLRRHRDSASPLVAEHVAWALQRHGAG